MKKSGKPERRKDTDEQWRDQTVYLWTEREGSPSRRQLVHRHDWRPAAVINQDWFLDMCRRTPDQEDLVLVPVGHVENIDVGVPIRREVFSR